MWYTTLVGDPTLYASSSRRVTLNGNGNNIHLSDLAIVGKLNYRNDSEPNDGLGGSYGTGSTISNMWVEHTKTGAWLVNSLGLVVNSCRFRDTIADGINLCVGMRGTTVTNCTARGTGDDCFPIWPATYTVQTNWYQFGGRPAGRVNTFENLLSTTTAPTRIATSSRRIRWPACWTC